MMSNQPLISIIISSYNEVKYKVNLLKIVNTVATLFIVAILLLDTYFYPGAVLSKFGVDSKTFFIIYILMTMFLKFKNIDTVSKSIHSLTKNLIFPAFFTISLLFIFFNNFFYETYVLNYFGLHTEGFLVMTAFFGYILYLSRDIKIYNKYQKFVYYFVPLSFLTLIFINHYNLTLFKILTMEDGPLEVFQFLSLLIAGILFLISALKEKKFSLIQVIKFGFAGFLMFVAVEEISWGQRILMIPTPESLANINYQQEITLHNIRSFQRIIYVFYIAISLWGVYGYKVLKYPFLYPKKYLILCFLMVGFFYLSSEYSRWYYEFFTSAKTGVHKWQEVTEFYLSIGFLLFAIDNLRHKRDN